jgi:hypothetical protein
MLYYKRALKLAACLKVHYPIFSEFAIMHPQSKDRSAVPEAE